MVEHAAESGYGCFSTRRVPRSLYQSEHVVAKPGDRIAVSGLDWRIATAATQVVQTPLEGRATPNPLCAKFTPQTGVNLTEHDQSVGSVITFGKFRTIHLATYAQPQFDLMCPNNRIGVVDLLLAARHGNVNAEFFVNAINPRVIVTNNGTRKGAQPDAMKIFFAAPRLEDLWQIHFSQLGGQEYTVPGMFIANAYDQQLEAMPSRRSRLRHKGSRRARRRAQRQGFLLQDFGATRRLVQRDEHA